jgi:hypothetical protein
VYPSQNLRSNRIYEMRSRFDAVHSSLFTPCSVTERVVHRPCMSSHHDLFSLLYTHPLSFLFHHWFPCIPVTFVGRFPSLAFATIDKQQVAVSLIIYDDQFTHSAAYVLHFSTFTVVSSIDIRTICLDPCVLGSLHGMYRLVVLDVLNDILSYTMTTPSHKYNTRTAHQLPNKIYLSWMQRHYDALCYSIGIVSATLMPWLATEQTAQ